MDIITEEALLKRIDDFLERHDMAPTTFGRKATGEPQLIDSIRNGRSPSLKVVRRVDDFMKKMDRDLAANPPPLELTPPPAEEERELPFGGASVNRTEASSPISSTTIEHAPRSAASGSCPDCSTADPQHGGARPPSCSSLSEAVAGAGEEGIGRGG